MGLPRRARLTRSAEIRSITKTGRRYRGEHFTACCWSNEGPVARLAVTVSRRVSLKAVVRNRIKRQMREAFRHQWLTMPSHDVVMIALPSSARCTRQDLRAALALLLARLAS